MKLTTQMDMQEGFMFRLFLKRKILSGIGIEQQAIGGNVTRPDVNTNRRFTPRYSIEHRHLTLMSDQNILPVRDISISGFACAISPAAEKKFNTGDVYEARFRYLGEIYDLNARVTWKSEACIGFEVYQPTVHIINFMRRLISPIAIANSLNPVEASFMNSQYPGKEWMHGEEKTDLFLWRNDHGTIIAWQLNMDAHVLEWSEKDGLKTGQIDRQNKVNDWDNSQTTMDNTINDSTKQFGTDILVALKEPLRNDIISTFMEL